jgi:hypothetical protein
VNQIVAMQQEREVEMAARVVRALEEHGCDVYQEVVFRGHMFDIVCLKGDELWIVEAKKQWNIQLLGQCVEALPFANRVFAAAPPSGHDKSWLFGRLGIGVVYIRSATAVIAGDLPPLTAADPKIVANLRRRLRPQHKTYAPAGCNGGIRFTPWRSTAADVTEYVAEHPGSLVYDVVAAIDHHYANAQTARARLPALIKAGLIPGVRLDRVTGKSRLFPVDEHEK